MKSKISSDWDKGKRLRRLFETTCKRCGRIFWVPKHVKAKYCSKICSSTANRTREHLTCQKCSKIFTSRPSAMVNAKHGIRFCSRKCKDLAQGLKGECPEIRPKHYGPAEAPLTYKNRIPLTECVGCGENRRFLLLTHHVDGNRKHNWDDNLECVCANCHIIRHLKIDVHGVWAYSTSTLTPREFLTDLTRACNSARECFLCKEKAGGLNPSTSTISDTTDHSGAVLAVN